MRRSAQIMSPSSQKRGKVFFFRHAVKYYSCAGASSIRICTGFFADYGGINEKQVYNVWKE